VSGVQFDILDTPPSDSEMLDGQSVIVSGAGELRRHTKINGEVFVEPFDWGEEDQDDSNKNSGTSDGQNTQKDFDLSNGNIVISSEESYIQTLDDSGVIRAQLGQVTTDNFGLQVSKSNGTEIFGLYGSTANLCGWNIDENAISKVSGNDYVKLDTSSSQPRLEIAQNNVVRLKAGQLDSDKYGLKIWNASNEVLMEIADGNIAAETANIGGWDITSSSLKKGTDIVLDATNKAISINDATFGNDGVQLQYNSGNPRMYIGDGSNAFLNYDGTKITWKASNAELDAAGKLIVTGATIGGWNISANEISSKASTSVKRMFLNNTNNRIEVRNASNLPVVSMGYLGGLAKNTSGEGNWAATDYGFWIKTGEKATIDGDCNYTDGDWLVESEGAFLIADAAGETVVKLGTQAGVRGLFIGDDLDGTPVVFAKYTSTGFRVGAQSGSDDYISYDTTNGLVVHGDMTLESSISSADISDVNAYATNQDKQKLSTLTNDTVTGVTGLFMNASNLGFVSSGTWKTYMSSGGDFFLSGTGGAGGGSLTWDSSTSTLAIAGSITVRNLDDFAPTDATNDDTANLKSKIFYQTSAPTSGHSTNDVWYDTNGGYKRYVYNGSSWVDSSDTSYDQSSTINTKNQTFIQEEPPNAITIGDLWIDTNDNNKLWRASATGNNWVAATPDPDTNTTTIVGNTITTAYVNALNINAATVTASWVYAGTLTAGQVNAVNINADSIDTGTLSADRISANSLDAAKISTLDMTGKSCTFTTGSIGGWTFTDTTIYRGSVGSDGAFTSNNGDITLGAGWISAKEFFINSSGVASFKGTLGSDTDGAISGGNVTITNLNATNISTGTLSADRISAGSIRANKITAGGANLVPSPAIFTSAVSLEAEGWTKASTRTELRWEDDAFAGSTYRCIEVGGYQDSYGSGNQDGNLASPLIPIDTSQTYRLKLDLAQETNAETDFGIQLRFYTSNGSSETASSAVNADGDQASPATGILPFYVASGYITSYSSKWVTIDRMLFPASATQTLMRGGGNLDEQDDASEVGITGHSAYYTNNCKMPIDAEYVKIFIINQPESYYQNIRVANISLTAVGEGLGVITGAKIQTSSTGKRIVMDGANNRFSFYDSSGNLIIFIDDNVYSNGGVDYPGIRFWDDNSLIQMYNTAYTKGFRANVDNISYSGEPKAGTTAGHYSSSFTGTSASNLASFTASASNWGSGNAYGMYISNGLAAKPSGGVWTTASDSRVKTVGDNYTTGLSDLIQLEPKYYKYNGKADGAPDDGVNYVGLIAQEAEAVIPSLVSQGKSEIDGVEVDDFRMMDTSELQYTIINAIKEMNDRLVALESS